MADIADIRAALAAALSAIPGIQASPYMLSTPMPPTIDIRDDGEDYHMSLGTPGETVKLLVRVFVGMNSDLGAQKLLDDFCAHTGGRSVKAACEADTSLGGLVADLTVTSRSGPRLYAREDGAGSVLGCEFTVEVLT